MGLDDFVTDGPRTKSKDNGTTNDVLEVIHTLPDIDLSDVDIPDHVTVHEVDYYKQDNIHRDLGDSIVFFCNKCNLTASSFEALIKHDRYKHNDKDWSEEFKKESIEQAHIDDLDIEWEDEVEDDDSDSPTDDVGGVSLSDDNEEENSGLDYYA